MTGFNGKYDFLSNFYPCDITYNNITYPSSENAYQAEKCINRQDKLKFINITPGQAKRLGKKVKNLDNWDDIKTEIMLDIVRIKFHNKKFKEMLLNTGDIKLVEYNNWNDKFWGVDIESGVGKNILGLILMKVRSELRLEKI